VSAVSDRLASVIKKVRDLRARSKSDNVNEAATAAAIADKLIQEHRISEAQLEHDAGDGPRADKRPILREQRRTMWRWHLVTVVSEHYGCAVNVQRSAEGYELFPVGKPDDLAIVRTVLPWLDSEILRIAGEAKARHEADAVKFETELLRYDAATRRSVERARARLGITKSTGPRGEPFKGLAFCLGAVVGIEEALAESKRAAMAKAPTSTALVLASRLDAARAAAATPIAQMVPTEVSASSAAFVAGVDAGRSIDVAGASRRRLRSGGP
jgi:hypothetical protein